MCQRKARMSLNVIKRFHIFFVTSQLRFIATREKTEGKIKYYFKINLNFFVRICLFTLYSNSVKKFSKLKTMFKIIVAFVLLCGVVVRSSNSVCQSSRKY